MSIQQLFFAGGKLNNATGGTITYDGDYQIHTFSSDGTFTVTAAPVSSTPVQLLIVAGGGCGRNGDDNSNSVAGNGGDGGTGGEVLVNSSLTLASFTLNNGYAITVGAGNSSSGQSGDNSSLVYGSGTTLTAYGGYLYGGSGGTQSNIAGTNGSSGTTSSISGTAAIYGSSGGGGGSGNNGGGIGSGGIGGLNAGNGGQGGDYDTNGGDGDAATGYGSGGGGGGGAGYSGSGYNTGGAGNAGYGGVVVIRFKYRNL
jgi:hypothetical protein